MNGFLGEIGKKLAERWAALLALPGLLFLATVATADTLGWAHALDLARLRARIELWAAEPVLRSVGGAVLTVAAVLAGSVAAGLVAAALGRILSRLWNLPGRRPPASMLAGARRRRSRRAESEADDPAATARQVSGAIARADRVSLVQAERPTWIGDRLHACRVRVEASYGLDLDAAWPRLWLLLPDTARTEILASREAYDASARLMGWALLYLLLTGWWWPAALIAAATGVTAWSRARASAAGFADLVESAVDLYGRELAVRLGHSVRDDGPLTVAEGEAITTMTRKSRWDPHSPLAD
ncbi:hypothetical protein [Nonomuraea wenchangensis]|uniref:hypothetical protein n=1 Tax=Nonomuraea wenchangensis TaxID=568860 RepID=UPI00332C513A